MKLACYLLGHEDEVRRSDLLMAVRDPAWAERMAAWLVNVESDHVQDIVDTILREANT